MEYSLRIYKNEYGVRHLNFIRKKFEVSGETEKTLEVVGKEQDLEMLMSAMFSTDEQFKALFPDYQNRKGMSGMDTQRTCRPQGHHRKNPLPNHQRRRHEQSLVRQVPFFLPERIGKINNHLTHARL